ncbi:MAG: MFS transporter [Pseudohongiellaceae bacterium]
MQIRHTLRALSYRNYRLFFYGQTLSIIGNWVQQIAMAWLVYRLSGSAWLLGLTGFAGQIAILLLAPFGGLWADRFDKQRLLLLTQAASAVPPVVLVVLSYAGWIEVWHVIAMALFAGVVNALDTPVRLSFTKEMVTAREDLPSAIALNALMQSIGRMIGPTIAGLLLAVVSEAVCFALNGASKVLIVATVGMMRVAQQASTPATGSVFQQLAEGVRYVWSVIPIRWLLPMVATISFMVTPYQTMMPIFAAEVFGGGADTLGFLIGAAGGGGVIGMLALGLIGTLLGLVLPGLPAQELLLALSLGVEALVVLGRWPAMVLLPAMVLHGYGLSVPVLGWTSMPLTTYLLGLLLSQGLLLLLALAVLQRAAVTLSTRWRRLWVGMLLAVSAAGALAALVA